MSRTAQIVAQFLAAHSIKLSPAQVNELQTLLPDQPVSKTQAARDWIAAHPGVVRKDAIKYMTEQLGFSHEGAATTFQNISKARREAEAAQAAANAAAAAQKAAEQKAADDLAPAKGATRVKGEKKEVAAE